MCLNNIYIIWKNVIANILPVITALDYDKCAWVEKRAIKKIYKR